MRGALLVYAACVAVVLASASSPSDEQPTTELFPVDGRTDDVRTDVRIKRGSSAAEGGDGKYR
jgi:hypothetical protein